MEYCANMSKVDSVADNSPNKECEPSVITLPLASSLATKNIPNVTSSCDNHCIQMLMNNPSKRDSFGSCVSPIYQGSFLIATSSNSPISCTSPKIANKTNLPTSSTPYPSVFNPPTQKVPKIQTATTSVFPSKITAVSEGPKAATTHYKTSLPSGAPLRQYTLSDLKNPAAAETDTQALSKATMGDHTRLNKTAQLCVQCCFADAKFGTYSIIFIVL